MVFEVNLINKMLHNCDVDLNGSTMQQRPSKSFLERYRSNEGFEKILVNDIEVA